jgi:hypothetical protein
MTRRLVDREVVPVAISRIEALTRTVTGPAPRAQEPRAPNPSTGAPEQPENRSNISGMDVCRNGPCRSVQIANTEGFQRTEAGINIVAVSVVNASPEGVCPTCASINMLVIALSKTAPIKYVRCQACGEVSTVPGKVPGTR